MLGQEPGHAVEQGALIAVAESLGEVVEQHPRHLVDLDIGVAELAAAAGEEEVVHGLVDPPLLRHEPEVDGAERGQHLSLDTGLLPDLAHRRLLGCLTGLDVALRQAPDQCSAPVAAADEGGPGPGAGAVDDQPAG